MDRDPELRALRVQVAVARSQLDVVMKVLAVASAAGLLVLVGLALWADSYREISDSGDEIEEPATMALVDLPAQAGDFDNGVVQTFAMLTIVALAVVVVATVAMLYGVSVVAGAVATAALVVAWVGLRMVVTSSGGRGAIGDLGAGAAAGAWWPVAAALWAGVTTWLVHTFRS